MRWTQARLDQVHRYIWEGGTKGRMCHAMGVSWDAIRRAFSRHGRKLPPFVKVSPSRIPAKLRRRVARRARRHFDGDTPRHRVVDKGADFITFVYNRTSTKYHVPRRTHITVRI